LGIDQVHIDRAGYGDRFLDSGFCDLVENDAFGGQRVQAQDLTQMPADGFSFTVLVRREPYFAGFLGEGF
jgi:hypothetical protein